ncbi:MAG: restriction endonuclease subunit S, partial [Bacteroidales bacterium]|nr:restriction endonuclease subunit S [Bacteroidales bacterium]
MTICDDLRQSVLQAAIQGKLTKQLPEDGTATDLLASIKAEKEQLIKEKKIKKEKPLAPISEDEIPFDIPESWAWTRLQSVVNIRSASRVHQSDWRTSGIPFYRAREIVKLSKYNSVDNELFVDEELYNKYASSSEVPVAGDLMVSGVGTLGASYIVKETDKFYYKDASVLCFENRFGIFSSFLKMMLESPWLHSQIYAPEAYGTTVATLTMERANQFLIPLPPLAEQHRIVARVDELMVKIDELEAVEKELVVLKKAFPGDMKVSLLQAAMQGKLTQQLPEESVAEIENYLH